MNADGVVLSEEDRDALEAERAELLAKIERANAKLARMDESNPDGQNAKRQMDRIREVSQESDGSSSTPVQGASGGAAGKGNAGGNGGAGGSGNAGDNDNGKP